MIKIYTLASNQATRQAEHWLMRHHLAFKEINILTDKITTHEFLTMLSLTQNGPEDIISKQSRAFDRLNLDFEKLLLEDILHILEENTTLLKVPLIMDERRLQVGFDAAALKKFVQKEAHQVRLSSSDKIRRA